MGNPRKDRSFVLAATAFFIAWKHLTAVPKRWVISSAALGVAAMLVLFTQGIVSWIDTSTTGYLDHTPADLVVTSTGVNDLLFSQAAIPQSEAVHIGQIPGIASATSILAINGTLSSKGEPLIGFVIGYPTGSRLGPWALAAGRTPQANNEVVLDRGLAITNRLKVGDDVSIIGQRMHIVGLSAGTNASGTFFAFVPIRTAQQIAGADIVSHIFVQLEPGASPNDVTSQIDTLPGIHALSKSAIAHNDRSMMDNGFARPAQIMVLICLIVGLLLASIILYTATVEHARDLAVLKAIGADAKFLIAVATIQSIILSVCGFILGLVLTEALRWGFYTFRPVIESYVTMQLVGEIFVLLLIVNLVALLLPARFLLQVDPQEVFKA
jgi:putative ABC transport system permease protein